MNVLIVEDEVLAAERLRGLLKDCAPDARVVDHLDSVQDVVALLKTDTPVDLIFLDIQLADGKSFEIFDKVAVEAPIIFTTAFDQYALQAFKVFSIDYLLKPIQPDDLAPAIAKFRKVSRPASLRPQEIVALRELLAGGSPYKERFVIKAGNRLQYKPVADVAYIFADGKNSFIVSRKENRKYLVDHTLEELETTLKPSQFFRISRKFILNIDSIAEVKGMVSTKLEVKLLQPCEHDLTVSRDRSHEFKEWLSR